MGENFDMTPSPASAVDTPTSRSPRFTMWVAFLIFSTITMGSAVEEKNQDRAAGELDSRGLTNQKWAIACSAVTFSLTLLMVLGHLFSMGAAIVVGTKIEGALCIILTAFWGATVAIVSDSSNFLAVDSEGRVFNGNLYYFSWAGFVTAIVISISYLRVAFNVDVAGEMKSRAARLTTWSALLASSLIVMGTSANVLDQKCHGNDATGNDDYCARTKFAVSIGAIVAALSLGVVGMKITTSSAPFMVEVIFSIIATANYSFGVAFITSAKGPGAPLGNLYYFTWISFMASFFLTASCVEDYNKGGAAAANGAGEGQDDEVQVESLDDTI